VNVPLVVKTKFSRDYPNSIPDWGLDGSYYSAVYYDQVNNLGRAVVYDKSGKVIRVDTEMSAGSYPLAINDYYLQNYPDEGYTVWSSKDRAGMLMYYSTRQGKKIWFDKNGKHSAKKNS
jgi:hypothetical protein